MEANQQQQQQVLVTNNPIIKPTETKEFLLSQMGQEIKMFELQQRQAMMYASSSIVPKEYQGQDKVGNIIIAMDMAKRLNANLLMIMQNLNVIQGRPSWSAKFLISTVNSCGRFEPIRYKFIEGEPIGKIKYNETVFDPVSRRNTYAEKEFDGRNIRNITCIAYTTAKGSKEVLESSPVDLRTAILEGWYTKKGSKWPVMARQMLMYRAASWWTNVYAPDLSMGLMTTEEAKDESNVIDTEYEDVTAKQEVKKHISFSQKGKTETSQENVDTDPGEVLNTSSVGAEENEPSSAEDLFK